MICVRTWAPSGRVSGTVRLTLVAAAVTIDLAYDIVR